MARQRAVQRYSSGAISPEFDRYFDSYADTLKLVDEMIARTGGTAAWQRKGPEFTGSRFS